MAETRSGRLAGDGEPDLRAARGERTRKLVLDAAERLFAASGFDGVSLRDIAQSADISLPLINFHFGGKEDLFRTVLSRRVEDLIEARLGALSAAESGRRRNSVRPVVDAFVEPYWRKCLSGDPQWGAYARLTAHSISDERWQRDVDDLHAPAVGAFMAELAAVRPGADPARLAAAFQIGQAGMITLVSREARAAASAGQARRTDAGGLLDLLVEAFTAGVERA